MVCIDWDEKSLRAIEATFSRSGMRIRKAMHVALAPGLNVRDPAIMGNFINRALREHRIRAKKALVDIPRQDAILNLVSLPRGTRDETAAMVHAQIAKDLPFSKDQAAIDFTVLDEKGSTTCQVWVAAVRSHVLDYYVQTLEAAGLAPERIGLRPYANQAAVVEGGDVAGRTVLVDVGPSMTEISVIRDACLVYSRAASVTVAAEAAGEREVSPSMPGDQPITLAEDLLPGQEVLDSILIEVSRTIQAYRAGDPGARIDRIILSGTGGVDERLRTAFESRFGSPTRLFAAPPSANWKRVTDLSAAPFVSTIGLALSYLAAETERFDFLHPKEPEAEQKERAKRRPVMALTVALFLAAGVVLAVQMLRIEQRKIDQVVQEREKVKKQIKEYDTLTKRHTEISQWIRETSVWVDELRLLAANFVPNEKAYVTGLSMPSQNEVLIDLASTDSMVATKLVEDLRKVVTTRPAPATGKPTSAPAFIPEVGKYTENPKESKYRFSDKVTVKINTLDKPKTGRAGQSGR